MTKANYCCHFIKGVRLAGAEKAATGMCRKASGNKWAKEKAGFLQTLMCKNGRREEEEEEKEGDHEEEELHDCVCLQLH